MRLKNFVINGIAIASICNPNISFANVPKEPIKTNFSLNKPLISFEDKKNISEKGLEKKNGTLLLEVKISETQSIIVTKKEIKISFKGAISGEVKTGDYSSNPIKSVAISEEKRYLFLVREDGLLTVKDMKEGYEYDFGDEELVKTFKEKTFISGTCKDWVYFVSSDITMVFWMKMSGEELKLSKTRISQQEIKEDATILPAENGLIIDYGEHSKTVLLPEN